MTSRFKLALLEVLCWELCKLWDTGYKAQGHSWALTLANTRAMALQGNQAKHCIPVSKCLRKLCSRHHAPVAGVSAVHLRPRTLQNTPR